MKRKQPAPAPTVNECPQCTTPHRCGRQDLSGARGPRCVGRADGLDDCDCLNDCGDDPWLEKGKSKPCSERAAREAAAELRRTAGPAEYASWFPISPLGVPGTSTAEPNPGHPTHEVCNGCGAIAANGEAHSGTCGVPGTFNDQGEKR